MFGTLSLSFSSGISRNSCTYGNETAVNFRRAYYLDCKLETYKYLRNAPVLKDTIIFIVILHTHTHSHT